MILLCKFHENVEILKNLPIGAIVSEKNWQETVNDVKIS